MASGVINCYLHAFILSKKSHTQHLSEVYFWLITNVVPVQRVSHFGEPYVIFGKAHWSVFRGLLAVDSQYLSTQSKVTEKQSKTEDEDILLCHVFPRLNVITRKNDELVQEYTVRTAMRDTSKD